MKHNKHIALLALVAIPALVWLALSVTRKPGPSAPVSAPPGAKPATIKPISVDPARREDVASGAEPSAEEHAASQDPAPLPAVLERTVSPSVATTIGLGREKADYNARTKAMRAFTRDMTAADVNALRLFLDQPFDDAQGLRPLQFHAIKNNVLDILLRQRQLPEGLGSDLVKMYSDPKHDEIWREYCVQYLANYYQRQYPTDTELPEDAERTAIEDTYWHAAAQAHSTVAGSAIIGLEQLSRSYATIDKERVGALAASLAASESCGPATRITAFRLAAMMQQTEVLDSARTAAQTGETTTLRIAAIATIGDLGDQTDTELLASFAASSDQRIKSAAERGLAKLRERG